MSRVLEEIMRRKPPRQERLRQAARILEELAAELNTREDRCDHCQVVKHENWPEYQLHQEVQAMARKCRRFAATLSKEPSGRDDERGSAVGDAARTADPRRAGEGNGRHGG